MGAQLRLHLHKMTEDLVQVAWFHDSTDFDYPVSLRLLEEPMRALRVALGSLVRSFSPAAPAQAGGDAMRALLTAGHELFEALFAASDRKAAAIAARDQYAQMDAAGNLSLHVKVDTSLAGPWPLAVPALDGVEEACANLTVASRLFWGLRHDLAVSVFRAGVAAFGAVAPSDYRMLAAVHRQMFEAAALSLSSAFERRMHELLTNRLGAALTYTVSDFERALLATGDTGGVKLRIAYLLGHAQGYRLQLSATEEITAARLARKIQSSDGTGRQLTFLFLNGCETAAPEDRFAFTELLQDTDVTGVVGTEVRVPDRFGFRFGMAFLRLVACEGVSFAEAMNRLRREHFPISLAYALYSADLALVAVRDPLLEALNPEANANFSQETVSCPP